MQGIKSKHKQMGLHAKSLPLCPTLWDAMDHNLPSFSIHGILQGRTLEWGALQGTFLTQGLNPYLWHLRALVGGFFTTSVTWEAPNKWDYIILKIFCTMKESIITMKGNIPNERRYFQIIYLISS